MLAPVPLSVEDAAALLEDPGTIAKSDIPHLLSRVLSTAMQVREMRQHFDNELRRRTEAQPRPGLQPTLSPERAARFLSPDQLKQLFDRFSQEQLQAVDLLRQRAAEDYERLQRTMDDVVAVVVHTLNQPGVPDETARQLSALVDRLRAHDKPGEGSSGDEVWRL
jgi:hypothetical protein